MEEASAGMAAGMGSANGLVTVRSRYSVAETLGRLLTLLETKGLTVFAVIDHSGEAERAGLRMPETKLVIFGSPKGGTPLMVAAPTLAIDLPLKLLVREEAQAGGETWVQVSYSSAEFLAGRHGLAAGMEGPLRGVEALAKSITE